MGKEWMISQRVREAVVFAAEQHGCQARKGTRIPYLVHPMNVAKWLIRYGASEELAIAGVLHDVVEDTPATVEEVEKRFGERVACLVQGASEADKAADWRTRKQATVNHVLECDDLELLALKCADKLDNLSDIAFDLSMEGEVLWKRFNTPNGRPDQAWYYGTLARAFSEKLAGTDWQNMAQALTDLVDSLFREPDIAPPV